MARMKKFDYFEAYEKLSDLAVRESELLLESFKSFDGASSLVGTLEAVHELEHQGDDINHDKAMEDFRNFKKSKAFKQLIVDVNTYEEEGDTLYLTAMRALHTQENPDVMHVLRWSRIYSRIEKCCDACEHAADVMNTILLKNL